MSKHAQGKGGYINWPYCLLTGTLNHKTNTNTKQNSIDFLSSDKKILMQLYNLMCWFALCEQIFLDYV